MARRGARRSRTVQVAALVAAAAFALAGCAGGAARGGGDASGGANGQLNRDATLVVASPSPSTILDPALSNNIGQNSFMAPIYDSLTKVDPTLQVQPMLATSWTFAPDGGYLELKLRDDVTFHDGTPFDANAVKVNIERGKTLQGSTIAGRLSAITGVDVVDPTTVRLRLQPGQGASLPATFALNAGMMVSPKAIAERASKLATDPGDSGSGPYVLTSAQPGVEIAYERAPSYWDDTAGLVKVLRMQTVTDNSARLNGVRTGAIDLAQITGSTPVAEALGLIRSGAVAGVAADTVGASGLLMNIRLGDMAKPEIRRAVAQAVNREDLVQGLFSGNAQPADQLYPKDMWGHSDGLVEQNPENPQAAKDLVTAAGGGTITISAPTGSTQEVIANALAAQLTAAGLNATVAQVPWGQFDAQFQAGEQQAQINVLQPNADPGLSLAQYVTGGYNISAGDAQVRDLAARADDPRLSTDQRAELFGQIWQRLSDEVMWVPLVRTTQAWVSTPGVTPADQMPWVRWGFIDVRTIATTAAS